MQVYTAAVIMWVLGPPSTSLQTTAYLATTTLGAAYPGKQDGIRLAYLQHCPQLEWTGYFQQYEWSDIRQF